MQDTPGFLALWHLCIPGLFVIALLGLAFYATLNSKFAVAIVAIILANVAGYGALLYFMASDHATLGAILNDGVFEIRSVMDPMTAWAFIATGLSTVFALPFSVLWSALLYAIRPRRPFYWQ